MNREPNEQELRKIAEEYRKQRAGKPYRPSNGTEHYLFEEDFCMHCKHYKDNPRIEASDCDLDLLNMTFLHDIDDPEYPKEWVYDKEGYPSCTAFEEE